MYLSPFSWTFGSTWTARRAPTNLRHLKRPIDHWEQKQRAYHFLGESYLQYGDAQLDVLTACFHRNGPPLPGDRHTCSWVMNINRKAHNSFIFDVTALTWLDDWIKPKNLRLAESEDRREDISKGVAYQRHESSDGQERRRQHSQHDSSDSNVG